MVYLMKKLRWQIILIVLAVIAILVLILIQKPKAEEFTGPAPAEGGLYIEGVVGQIGRLNPLFDEFNSVDKDVNNLVFSGLIKFDDRGVPVPDLAESWGVSLDGLKYNFTLKGNAVWHDGEPVTSQDVTFTIGLMQNPDNPLGDDYKQMWSGISVNIYDDKNFSIILEEAYAPFLEYLDIDILPEHLLGGLAIADILDSPFNLSPVGCGPYKFEDLIVEEGVVKGITLKAFDDYYDERAFIDEVVIRYYGTSEEVLAAYEEGDVMAIGTVDQDTFRDVLQNPDLNLYSSPLPQLSLVVLNLDNIEVPFLQETDVRKALLLGTNRDWIINNVLEGQAVVAYNPVFPGTWAYSEEVEMTGYQPDEAVELLKNAGFVLGEEGTQEVRSREGVPLSFTLTYPEDELHEEIANAIMRDWARLGVEVKLEAVDYETLVRNFLIPRKFEAVLVEYNMFDSPDPDPYTFWHQTQVGKGQNFSGWNDRRASEYLEQARVMTRMADRERLYKNFQNHFEHEVPAILLYYPVYSYAVDNQVQGVKIGPIFNPSDRLTSLERWYLISESPEITVTETPGE